MKQLRVEVEALQEQVAALEVRATIVFSSPSPPSPHDSCV